MTQSDGMAVTMVTCRPSGGHCTNHQSGRSMVENKDNVFTLIRKLSDPWFWLSEQRDPLLIMGREGGATK